MGNTAFLLSPLVFMVLMNHLGRLTWLECDADETKDLSLILLSSLIFHMHEVIPWLQIAPSLQYPSNKFNV